MRSRRCSGAVAARAIDAPAVSRGAFPPELHWCLAPALLPITWSPALVYGREVYSRSARCLRGSARLQCGATVGEFSAAGDVPGEGSKVLEVFRCSIRSGFASEAPTLAEARHPGWLRRRAASDEVAERTALPTTASCSSRAGPRRRQRRFWRSTQSQAASRRAGVRRGCRTDGIADHCILLFAGWAKAKATEVLAGQAVLGCFETPWQAQREQRGLEVPGQKNAAALAHPASQVLMTRLSAVRGQPLR